MRNQLWGIDPKAAAAALAEQAERIRGQMDSLEALLRTERARTAELRRRQAAQAEAFAAAAAEQGALREQLQAVSAELELCRSAAADGPDLEVAEQEERLKHLRQKLRATLKARADLIRTVHQQLLRTEAGEADGEEN